MSDIHERAAQKALVADLREQYALSLAKAQHATSLKSLQDWLFTARILVERLAAVDVQVEIEQSLDLARLPTFGGRIPPNFVGLGIWSWDAKQMLVGDCIERFRLVPRPASQ